MVKHAWTFRMNYLGMFDHFVGLLLKELKINVRSFVQGPYSRTFFWNQIMCIRISLWTNTGLTKIDMLQVSDT